MCIACVSRNPIEDLRSVPVFVDADDDVWGIENSLEPERYLLAQEKDCSQVISERDDVAQNVDQTHEQGDPVIIEEELHDMMVPAPGNAAGEEELLHRQKQEVTIRSNKVAELHEQSKQLMIERDNAVRKVKFLEEQKKQMMTEWNFSIKEIVEL